MFYRLFLWEISGKQLENSLGNRKTIGKHFRTNYTKTVQTRVKINRRQTLIFKSLPPNYLIIKPSA